MASINLFSKIGDRLFYTAMLTTAASLPESGIGVMIVSISETLPILFSILLGPYADRTKKKTSFIILSSLVRMLMYLLIGQLFNYSNSLLLIIVASLLNFISDLAGNFVTALESPFTKKLVRNEHMTTAQGFISIGTQLIYVLATFIGSFLLSIFTKKTIGYLNAFIFLIVAIVYLKLGKQLRTVENTMTTYESQSTFATIKQTFKSLFSNKVLVTELMQLSLLNGFFGGLTPIFVLFLQTNSSLPFITTPVKISLLSGLITISMIIGNLVSPYIFKNNSIKQLNNLAGLMIIFTGIAFFNNQLVFVYISSSLISCILGIVSPRFSAEIIRTSPIEKIGSIVTSVNSFLVIMPPLCSMIFPALANINLAVSYLGFIIYSLLILLFNLFSFKRETT